MTQPPSHKTAKEAAEDYAVIVRYPLRSDVIPREEITMILALKSAFRAGASWQLDQVLALLRSGEALDIEYHRFRSEDWADWIEKHLEEKS